MSVYTFTRTTQWSFEVIQVIANNELSARELIKDINLPVGGWQYYLESEIQTTEEKERALFSRYIENTAYEG